MQRYQTDRTGFSRLLRHMARKLSGYILTTWSSHWGHDKHDQRVIDAAFRQ